VYRIGVDIGGTFTDFALFDARGAKMSVHKRLTTPHDPSEAVTEGIDALLKREGVAIADISDAIREQYVLGYRPTNSGRDGRFRRVRVKIAPPPDLPPLHISWRTGYYAPY